MEITQRKNEGDLEGQEKGSNFRLRFNIWKTEKEWKFWKEHEAKNEAKTESILAPADESLVFETCLKLSNLQCKSNFNRN